MEPATGSLRCSFCQKAQNTVGKLISSPSDYPRAYICDECVAVCAHVVQHDRPQADKASGPVLNDAQIEDLLNAVFEWAGKDKAGENAFEELAEVRRLAESMMGEDGK